MRRPFATITVLFLAVIGLSGQISDGGAGFSRGSSSLTSENTWSGEQTFRETISLNNTAPLQGVGKLVIDPRDTPQWAAGTTYSVGDVVQPTTLYQVNDYGVANSNTYTYGLFECTSITTGISAGSEPAWGTVGTTVTDGGVTWTRRGGQRRVFEIYDISSAGRTTGVPVAWFDAMGQFKSFRAITLGGTSNGIAPPSEDYTLWPPIVPNTGSFGGSWLGVVPDGDGQVGFGFNAYAFPSTCWAFQIVDGTPLTPASQKELFAIGRYGGMFWSGTSGGHTLDSTIPDGDTTNYTISLQPNTSNISLDIYNGATAARIGGKLANSATGVGNVGASGPDDLKTYTLPANALNSNGKGVKIRAYGTTANNANAKTVALVFGSQTVITKSLKVSVAGTWSIDANIVRSGASTQDVYVEATNNNGTALATADGETVFRQAAFVAGTQTETSTIVIKCQSTVSTGDSDIIHEGFLVEYLN